MVPGPASRPPAAPIGLGLPRARRSATGPVLSLVAHLLLLALAIRVAPALTYEPPAGELSPLDPGGGGGGGGGGRAVQVVALGPPAPARPPVEAVPQPVPRPVPPPVPAPAVEEAPELPPVPAPAADTLVQQADSGAGRGTGRGTGEGTGRGSGSGSGSGSGTGSGTGAGRGPGGGGGGTARPPEPRQLILPPPDIPGSLRGTTITVTFRVAADGRVTDVALDPVPQDRGFARKLEDVMRSYRFRPARSPEGLPVPGTTTVSLTF